MFALLALNGCYSNDKTSRQDKTYLSNQQAEACLNLDKNCIQADFISLISKSKYKNAIELLHPELKKAWTIENFKNDWMEIRQQISEKWQPVIIEEFSGMSETGSYKLIAYSLERCYKQIPSVGLASMDVDNQQKIVDINIRVPYKTQVSEEIPSTTSGFISALQNENYDVIETMMTAECKREFPRPALLELHSVLGDDISKASRKYYRICANTVWYDAVRLQLDTPLSFVEIVIQSNFMGTKIVGLNCKIQMSDMGTM